jgi:hypothetical protein
VVTTTTTASFRREALAARIELARADGDADLGDTYYVHRLHALETLVAASCERLRVERESGGSHELCGGG